MGTSSTFDRIRVRSTMLLRSNLASWFHHGTARMHGNCREALVLLGIALILFQHHQLFQGQQLVKCFCLSVNDLSSYAE